MQYAAARSQIQTGDIIAVHYSNGLFWWLVKYICRSDIVHTGIAVWIDGGLYVAEMQPGGNVLRPLSQQHSAFSVYRYAQHHDYDADTFCRVIMVLLRTRVRYGFFNLVSMAIKKLLNFNVGYSKSAMTCGTFCLVFFRKFFSTFAFQYGQHITPADLVKQLNYQFTIDKRLEV